jgi:DNA mismatch repair protein MutL
MRHIPRLHRISQISALQTLSPTKVRLLPEAVASQVAAGEVVERPASILKELVENSLDAGAGRIDVEWERGGTSLIRVRDDGEGMNREDAMLCLERHATSKIQAAEDLGRITTFGFRGEAVPSIASVSRFRLVTRHRAGASGTEILVDGGRLREVRESGEAPGTLIEVRALFYNLPARKKFLRTELTETGHLLHTFHTFALAHPEVAFSLQKDGRLLHQLAPTTELRVRVLDLFGEEFLEKMLPAPPLQTDGISLHGLIGRPNRQTPERSTQFFFLNRRPVVDAAIVRGLRAAWGGSGERLTHWGGILFLEMDPASFDCNVHPAKREVRFLRPQQVSTAVEKFAVGALAELTKTSPHPPPESRSPTAPPAFPAATVLPPRPVTPPTPSPELWPAEKPPTSLQPSDPPQEKTSPAAENSFPPATASTTPEEPTESAPTLPTPPRSARTAPEDFRFLGILGERYQLWAAGEGLVLLQIQHAHERIFYEQIIAQLGGAGPAPAQQLLPPAAVALDTRDVAWVAENTTVLAALGLLAEPFGHDVVKVDSLPAGLDHWAPEELLPRLIQEIRSGSRLTGHRFLQDEMALTLARLRAARQQADAAGAPRLLQQLFACEMPYTSPSGKPVLLQMGWRELERKFTPSAGW